MRKFIDYKNLITDLLGLLKGLRIHMFFAILLGSLGHIFASLLPSLGVFYLSKIILEEPVYIKTIALILFLLAILRALFKYTEQLLNHFIAFKTLAIIRDRVFKYFMPFFL